MSSFEPFLKCFSQFTTLGPRPDFEASSPPDLRIDAIESLWKNIADNDDWSQFYQKIESIKVYGQKLGFR